MAQQNYEVLAWESFSLEEDGHSNVSNPTYQWYENGIAVNGATAASLTIAGGKKAGVYTYTRTVTNAPSCGESNAITVKVKVNTTTTDKPSYAASTYVWTAANLQWSDVIAYDASTTCTDKSSADFSSDPANFVAEWGTRTSGEVKRYYYSWTCVTAAAATLCNNGWHLPSKNDFEDLVNYVKANYKDDPRYANDGGTILGGHPDFGWDYGGYVSGYISSVGTYGNYWSSTEADSPLINNAHRLRFYVDGRLGALTDPKYYGLQVRCVK
jgi:uncharacterized protein (TIGR02145 family)